jgi:hypothetical protein
VRDGMPVAPAAAAEAKNRLRWSADLRRKRGG